MGCWCCKKKIVDAICIKEEEERGEELKDTSGYNGNKTSNLLVNNKGNEKGEELKNKKGNNLNHSINDYERIKTLGKGAFGTVFLVRLKSDE